MRPRRGRVAAPRGGVALCVAALLAAAGCGGGGGERQDENEPEGDFEVEVVESEFPEAQKLAKTSRMTLAVKNVDSRAIPVIAVTVQGFNRKLRNPVDPSEIDPRQADPERSVFVVNKSPVEFLRNRFPSDTSLVDREVNPPSGQESAYVDTYTLGELPPGETALFRWDVTAVQAGPYSLRYEVSAGLDGRANAVTVEGAVPKGLFSGVIEREQPQARVAADGETVVTSDGRRIRNNRGVQRTPGK